MHQIKAPRRRLSVLSGKNLRRGMESSKDHQLFSGKGKARTDACDGI